MDQKFIISITKRLNDPSINKTSFKVDSGILKTTIGVHKKESIKIHLLISYITTTFEISIFPVKDLVSIRLVTVSETYFTTVIDLVKFLRSDKIKEIFLEEWNLSLLRYDSKARKVEGYYWG